MTSYTSSSASRRARIKLSRKDYEFSFATKMTALERDSYTCQKCKKHRTELTPRYLEVHHRIPIWFAMEYLPHIAPIYIKSLDCALSLCQNCHDTEHEQTNLDELWTLTAALLGVNLHVADRK